MSKADIERRLKALEENVASSSLTPMWNLVIELVLNQVYGQEFEENLNLTFEDINYKRLAEEIENNPRLQVILEHVELVYGMEGLADENA